MSSKRNGIIISILCLALSVCMISVNPRSSFNQAFASYGATEPLIFTAAGIPMNACHVNVRCVGVEYAKVAFTDSSNPSNDFDVILKIPPNELTTFHRDVLIDAHWVIEYRPVNTVTTISAAFYVSHNPGECDLNAFRGRAGNCGGTMPTEPQYVDLVVDFFPK